MYSASTAFTPAERKAIHERSRRNLLWLGIFSIIMVFAGFTSYYVVSMGSKGWVSIELPQAFWLSSAVILLSSVTMNMAQSSIKKGLNRRGAWWLLGTLLLGGIFTWSQFQGWDALVANGVYFAGPTFTPGGGMLYVLTAVHVLHLAGGLIAVTFTGMKAWFGLYSPENMLGVQLCSIYWHFLDALWIYLFLFLTIFK